MREISSWQIASSCLDHSWRRSLKMGSAAPTRQTIRCRTARHSEAMKFALLSSLLPCALPIDYGIPRGSSVRVFGCSASAEVIMSRGRRHGIRIIATGSWAWNHSAANGRSHRLHSVCSPQQRMVARLSGTCDARGAANCYARARGLTVSPISFMMSRKVS
jgi:hypothetical protein